MTDDVVLLDDAGHACGIAPKATVHDDNTPLHLAFSCYLFDPSYRFVLLAQRAWSKRTWPGIWSNSCCGHPPPGMDISEAIVERVHYELGVQMSPPQLALPDFRYRAAMENGVVENEICPVYVGTIADVPTPNPDEVAGYRWLPWTQLCDEVLTDTRSVSPWCKLQVAKLAQMRYLHSDSRELVSFQASGRAMTRTVTVRHNFETAHRLPILGGKCVNLHGHSWWTEITVAGALNEQGILVDFGILKARLRDWIDANLDHGAMLGHADPLVPALLAQRSKLFRFGLDAPSHGLEWPTVENVSELLARVTAGFIAEAGWSNVTVHRVKVTETHVNAAELTEWPSLNA